MQNVTNEASSVRSHGDQQEPSFPTVQVQEGVGMLSTDTKADGAETSQFHSAGVAELPKVSTPIEILLPKNSYSSTDPPEVIRSPNEPTGEMMTVHPENSHGIKIPSLDMPSSQDHLVCNNPKIDSSHVSCSSTSSCEDSDDSGQYADAESGLESEKNKEKKSNIRKEATNTVSCVLKLCGKYVCVHVCIMDRVLHGATRLLDTVFLYVHRFCTKSVCNALDSN